MKYYRFGSIFTSGYELIPGVLDEPWYTKGIMHWSYIFTNLKRFIWQMNLEGNGLGIIWAEPYLFLLPLVINKKNLWLVCLGIAQFMLVLAHGFWGAYQFDFRFLMDCLWIFVPLLMLAHEGWKYRLIWISFLISALVHLTFIGRFM